MSKSDCGVTLEHCDMSVELSSAVECKHELKIGGKRVQNASIMLRSFI